MNNTLIIDNEELKINKNEMNDGTKLKYIDHYLGITFPPFLFYGIIIILRNHFLFMGVRK